MKAVGCRTIPSIGKRKAYGVISNTGVLEHVVGKYASGDMAQVASDWRTWPGQMCSFSSFCCSDCLGRDSWSKFA